jgi:hypothetical protein
MLRIPHCLDNRLTDGGKVVSPTHLPHTTPQKHYLSVSGTNFCYKLTNPQGLMRPEGLDTFKNSVHRVSNPRPSGLWLSALTTTLPHAPDSNKYSNKTTFPFRRIHISPTAGVEITLHVACL